MPTWISHQPAAWSAFFTAVLDAVVIFAPSFGYHIAPEQQAALVTVITFGLQLIVHNTVVPTAKLTAMGVTLAPQSVILTPPPVTTPAAPAPAPAPPPVVPPAPPAQGVP